MLFIKSIIIYNMSATLQARSPDQESKSDSESNSGSYSGYGSDSSSGSGSWSDSGSDSECSEGVCDCDFAEDCECNPDDLDYDSDCERHGRNVFGHHHYHWHEEHQTSLPAGQVTIYHPCFECNSYWHYDHEYLMKKLKKETGECCSCLKN